MAPLDRAEWICDLVHASLDYADGVTSVRTTAAEALAGGRGVCQDMAHVMLALCHLVGLPARYVSGHLIGQGGTHAWVEVVVPRARDAIAVPFDPCHGRRAGSAYVTIAAGRDYSDVAPTSGSYVGTSGSPADRPAPGGGAGRRLRRPGRGAPGGRLGHLGLVRLCRIWLSRPRFTTGRPEFGSRWPPAQAM